MNFKKYLENKALLNHKLKIEVSIKTSHSVEGLQMVNFVSRHCLKNTSTVRILNYNIIKDVIVEESSLFS
jgi:hypothetical protein